MFINNVWLLLIIHSIVYTSNAKNKERLFTELLQRLFTIEENVAVDLSLGIWPGKAVSYTV